MIPKCRFNFCWDVPEQNTHKGMKGWSGFQQRLQKKLLSLSQDPQDTNAWSRYCKDFGYADFGGCWSLGGWNPMVAWNIFCLVIQYFNTMILWQSVYNGLWENPRNIVISKYFCNISPESGALQCPYHLAASREKGPRHWGTQFFTLSHQQTSNG